MTIELIFKNDAGEVVCQGEEKSVIEAEGELERLARFYQKAELDRIFGEKDGAENENEVSMEKITQE